MAISTSGEWLTLPVAALRLDTTVESVRRRIKSGQLRGRRVGGRWQVRLEGAGAPAEAPSSPTPQLADTRWLDLMRDLLAENDALGRQVARLSDERAELYGRCGYLQGQLAAAQAQVRALEAPASAATAEGTERRRWWRLFRAG